jgi:hypothetical protein
MSISSFLSLALFFSAFNPLNAAEIKAAAVIEDSFSSLTLITTTTPTTTTPSPSKRVSFSPVLSTDEAVSSASPRGRSRSDSGCSSPMHFRKYIKENNTDAIFALNPIESLADRGKSPLALLFEYKRFDLAAELMEKNILAADENMIAEFVRIALSSSNPKSIECVVNVLKSAEMDHKAVFAMLFPMQSYLFAAILKLQEDIAFPLIKNIIDLFEIELDIQSHYLLLHARFFDKLDDKLAATNEDA